VIAGLLPIAGGALGAAAMYLFDPERGVASLCGGCDQILRGASKLEDALDAVVRDVAHRAQGAVAEGRSKMEDTPGSPTRSWLTECVPKWDESCHIRVRSR